MKAYDLGPINPLARGEQRLYRLDPPMATDRDTITEYVVVSAADAMFSGPETYIFPADKDGKVTSWGELNGSYQGGFDHEEALSGAGYTVVTEATR